ncbi:MAG TPA: MBG domain-containing protein [Pyrinomonadaceae bacterium]|nr:MBG domain-containing protein [Pyrinomonadaceae bacterium]
MLILAVAVVAMALGSTTSSAGTFGQFLRSKAAAMIGVSAASVDAHALDANLEAEDSSMATERRAHTATRLQDGRVLIAGGENSGGALNGTEIFDPATGTFSASGNMGAARADHSATLLADGRVLFAGGRTSAGSLATTEIFDPATGMFAAGPSMSVARAGHSATLFADGRIFIAGGDANGTAEVLSSSLSDSSVVGAMSGARSMHSAALMQDGRVLLVGGRDGNGNALNTGEIFGAGFSTIEKTLKLARVRPHVRVLFDGKVQIIGGNNDGSMEIFDPAEGAFGAYAHVLPESDPCTGLHNQVLGSQTRAALFHTGSADELLDRSGHTITEIGGQALVVGGSNGAGAFLNSSSVVASSSAAISTNKMDYAPGESAIISGRGFQAGEVVRVKIHEDPHTPQERGFDVTADGDGNFSGEYLVMDYDLNMKFIVGARGLTSGRTAQTTFTDSNTFNVTPLSQSVAAGSTNTFVWTFTATNSANVATTTFTIPAGWTAPQTGAGPGQVTVTAGTCAASLNSVSGQVVTINQASGGCNNNTTFTLTYANATAPSPATTTVYTFVNQHGQDPQVTVTANAATKLAFTTGDHNGTYGQCLPAISIQTQNASNVATNVSADTTVNLATGNFGAGGSGAFHSDSGCTTPITTVLIATGNNSASFFYKATGRGDGTHDITVSASGLTSATQTQTINAAALTITASNKTKTYGDAVVFDETSPSTDFSVVGLVNTDTVDSITLTSTGAAATATVAGSPYSIAPSNAAGTGLANYSISYVNGTLTVDPKDLTITASNKTKTYGDTVVFDETSPSTDFSVVGLVNTDTVDSITLTSAGAAAGAPVSGSPYNIVPSAALGTGLGNYDISYVNGTLTVNKASLTITASSHTITFSDPVPTITASYTGFVAGDDATDLTVQPTCSTTYTVGSLIGTYPTKCENAVSGNYNFTYVDGTVTVLTACSAFNGFLAPIGGNVEAGTGGSFADPVRAFKLSSTIPVKFNAICFGVPLTTGIHTLEAIKYSNSTTSDAPIDASPTDAATTGNQFRLSGTEWHFNLNTKALGNNGQGKWLLRATLFDGSTYTVWVELKK